MKIVLNCVGAAGATANCDTEGSVKLCGDAQEGFVNQLTQLEHDMDGEELTYYSVARSGGKSDARMSNLFRIPAGNNFAGASIIRLTISC